MNDKLTKNIITWLCFTVLFGSLPIIFLIIGSWVTGERFTAISVSKEMFFLNIVMCADALKTLHNKSYEETSFSKGILGISIFILVISSVLYGITLIKKEINIEVYNFSSILYLFSTIIGFITQVRDGLQKEEEDTNDDCIDFTDDSEEN